MHAPYNLSANMPWNIILHGVASTQYSCKRMNSQKVACKQYGASSRALCSLCTPYSVYASSVHWGIVEVKRQEAGSEISLHFIMQGCPLSIFILHFSLDNQQSTPKDNLHYWNASQNSLESFLKLTLIEIIDIEIQWIHQHHCYYVVM